MENNTKALTEKQQAVWDLRQQGLTKKKIAETLGLSVNMVTTHLANAERRFREYEPYLAQEEKNNQIVDIDLTRGELEMIVYAICEYQQALIRQAHYNVKTEWRGRLPFGASLSQTLSEKIQMKYMGESFYGLYSERIVIKISPLTAKPDGKLWDNYER